jgi:excisionase family DNA binding protein
MPSSDATDLLTQSEAWNFLRIKRTKFYELRKRGAIPTVRCGARSLRFRRGDLESFVTRHTTLAIPPVDSAAPPRKTPRSLTRAHRVRRSAE